MYCSGCCLTSLHCFILADLFGEQLSLDRVGSASIAQVKGPFVD